MWAASLGIVDASASPAIQKRRRWKGHVFAMNISGDAQHLWLMGPGMWQTVSRTLATMQVCSSLALAQRVY